MLGTTDETAVSNMTASERAMYIEEARGRPAEQQRRARIVDEETQREAIIARQSADGLVQGRRGDELRDAAWLALEGQFGTDTARLMLAAIRNAAVPR